MPETKQKTNQQADDELIAAHLSAGEQMWTANLAHEARLNLRHEFKAVNDQILSEKRNPTADENQALDRLHSRGMAFKALEDRRKHEADRAAFFEGIDSESRGRRVPPEKPGAHGDPDKDSLARGDYTVVMARGRYQKLARGLNPGDDHADPRTCVLANGSAGWARHTKPYLQAVNDFWTGQANGQQAHQNFMRYAQAQGFQAALQTDLSTAGGYMVMPEQFVAELLMNVDDMRFIRKLARVFQTNAQTLGAVKRTSKMASFGWGAELSQPLQDVSLQFGKRSLTPHYMTGAILASRDLLRSAMLPVDEIIRYEIARDSGELEENAFLTGTGANQPLGVFTASADGIDTSRDLSTGNTATAVGADHLRAMKYTLKAQYLADPSLAWIWSRTAISLISRLKDGDGQYLWREGMTAKDPDTMLNIPFYMSEFVPSVFTTGLYVGILGAFRYYWIADSLEMDMQQLVELFALSNQIAFVARRKVDGMPQIAEAFVRSKLA